jgi:hypothetical protein
MKKLVMLAIVLAMCAPSFGAILVYKLNAPLKGFHFQWNERYLNDANQVPPLIEDTTTLTSAQLDIEKITGYIVADVNVNALSDMLNDKDPEEDSNTAAAIADGVGIILVDKMNNKFRVIYDTYKDPDLLVFDPNYGRVEADMFKAVKVLNTKGKQIKKTLVVFCAEGLLRSEKETDDDVWTQDYSDFDFDYDLMTGPLTKFDIDGSGNKVLVPKSLLGNGYRDIETGTATEQSMELDNGWRYEWSDVYSEEELLGTASMMLDIQLTKEANQRTTKTTRATVDAIVENLLNAGYNKVLPPANPVDPWEDEYWD